MQLIKFSHFDEGVIHGISTRHGGVSTGHHKSLNLGLIVGDREENIRENYLRFFKELGVSGEKLVIAYQEHTDEIFCVDNDYKGNLASPLKAVDGYITNVLGISLVVRFADCQGVLFYDPVKKVVAAVHSGWRGNVQNIIGKCVRMMKEKYGCAGKDILAGVSQSLGYCCAEFSDPRKELPVFMHKYIGERNHVNLKQCARDQLVEAGLLEKNIEMIDRCTVCEKDAFFSHRGDKGKTGHMAALIQLV